MGQAALDLPDPLLSVAPVSSSNTDDLLAQLAGEEIERLLAEGDELVGTTTNEIQPHLAQIPPSPSASPAAPSAVSSLVEPPVVAQPPAPAPNQEVELNAIFTQLENSEKQAPVLDKASPATPLDTEPSAADALAQEMLEDAAVSRSGRAALSTGAGLSTAPAHQSGESTESSNTPIHLRLLAWMNSPLEAYPDQVRDLIGKIAILTTVNAAAVLAYVIFVRNH